MNEKTENPLAYEYSKSVVPVINLLCEPLFSTFGLTTFIYVRVFYDGSYILLSNQTHWVKNWLQNHHSIKNTAFETSLQNVSEKEPFYFLWDTASQDKLIQSHNNFDIWHGFDIDFRLEDSVEVWAFCTTSDREQINNFYLNNFKLFHRFCLYFREKASAQLELKDKTQFAKFTDNFDISFRPSISKMEEVNLFLPYLLPDKYSLRTKNGIIHLSKREIECTLHLSQGKTAKETAKILEISPRTVESYIVSTKYKTGCYNKSELGDLIRNAYLKWL